MAMSGRLDPAIHRNLAFLASGNPASPAPPMGFFAE
jgi:hypothetical protein